MGRITSASRCDATRKRRQTAGRLKRRLSSTKNWTWMSAARVAATRATRSTRFLPGFCTDRFRTYDVPIGTESSRGGTVARTRSFTTADAVRAARDQFWEHGYEATSLADLERVTGLNRSSLYQAFGNKRQLFALAVEN